MASSWIELWSEGAGRTRTYCGVAHTDFEFAVDVFSGDTCLSSEVFATHSAAVEAARALRRRYTDPTHAPTHVIRRPVDGLSAQA